MSTKQEILGKRLHNNPEAVQTEEPNEKAQVSRQLYSKQ
jgi:hypothetical protein